MIKTALSFGFTGQHIIRSSSPHASWMALFLIPHVQLKPLAPAISGPPWSDVPCWLHCWSDHQPLFPANRGNSIWKTTEPCWRSLSQLILNQLWCRCACASNTSKCSWVGGDIGLLHMYLGPSLSSLACDSCFVSLDPSICGSVTCPLFKLPVEKPGQEVKTSLGSEAWALQAQNSGFLQGVLCQ